MIEQHKTDACTTHTHVHLFRRVSWTAVFVGALVAVGIGFLLNLFGLAIGLSMFSVNPQGNMVFAVGGLLGVVIGIVVTMMTAGFAAGFLGRNYCPTRNLGILYGFTTWTMALLLSAVITVHIGNYVTAYTSRLSNAMVVATISNNNTLDTNANSVQVSNKVNNKANETPTVVKVSATPSAIAWSAFIVFALFLIGAISCCIGACWGMSCSCIED